MTRSAPRYLPPSDRARRAARDPFLVRLGVLLAAGVIITPIAALVAHSNGHEVVRGGQLPGAAVALEPANDSSTVAPPQLAVAPAQGTVPGTIPPSGTLPATIAPPPTEVPTTEVPATTEAMAAGVAARPSAAAPKPTPAPTTAAPKPPAPPPPTQPPPRSWPESEIAQIIRSVFPDDIEEHALAIAHRESRFDPNARNFCCTGLFQIYGAVHEKLINSLGFTVDQLTDPLVNCVVALAIYQRSGWAPWGG
jgi:hypothetical protein